MERVAEQPNWTAEKIGVGLAALAASLRYFFKARSTNAHDRIHKLERQLAELRQSIIG